MPKKFTNPLNLVLIYPKSYCGACIDLDLPILKEISKMYPSVINVADNGIDYNMISLIDENSENVSLVSFSNTGISERVLQVDLPIIYLVDFNGQIILKYQSVFGNVENHKTFFEKVLSLLSITYSVN
ncbi:MAG: hypothetical protein U5K31_13095 [Balneolaceae bacterium]|nr:hypothetical protein [Balneolaceae bacterium]